MDTVRIYRIECPDERIGPYNTFNDAQPLLWREGKFHGRPTPQSEHPEGHYMKPDEYSGFISIDQMNKWMHGVKKKLRECGFVMGVYEAPADQVVVLEHQVCFKRDEATHVADRRIP